MFAYLEISTWAGLPFDAQHYYGSLVYEADGDYKRIDVEYFLTEEHAQRLNELDRHKTYKAGGRSTRFDREVDVIHEGIHAFQQHLGRGVLLLGNNCRAEPQRVLFAYPPHHTAHREANKLFEEFEALYDRGGWDKHCEEMEELTIRWYALFGIEFEW